MIITNVKDWFKTLDFGFNDYMLGPLVNTKRHKLISFNRGTVRMQQKALGGMHNTSYSRMAVNCIVHWTDDLNETDSKLQTIQESLNEMNNIMICQFKVVELLVRNCVFIGVDENDIYEYALDLEIIYQREKAQEDKE